MKKLGILILGISLTAASCDVFGTGAGIRGVFVSEDGGETFIASNTLINKGNISAVSVNAIALAGDNSNFVYLGTTQGLYKSEDAGKTWRYILSGIVITAIAVDPTLPNTIYASGISGPNGKIIKSPDSGASWVDIYSEPSKNNTVASIAVSRANPSLILAGLANGEIIRSTDAGRTWQISQDLADRVIELNFSTGIALALTQRQGLFRSSDGGLSWTSITDDLTGSIINPTTQSQISVSAFYDLALDEKQSGVLYLGTEQGLLRSVNSGLNWSLISLPVRNSALLASSVAVSPDNSNLLFVAVGSTIFKSNNGGVTWETKSLPVSADEVHVILINPASLNVVYLGLRSQQ